MNRCEAPNCKMRTYAPTAEQLKMAKNNYVISFHKFPDDPDKRQFWINAAKKPSWKPPMFNSPLCSLHFRDDCFDENNELYDHAVPTIFFDDFGSHMREIVEKLGMQCKLDDDDSSKTSRGSENAINSSMESNVSLILSGTDEDDVTSLQPEKLLVYDSSPKKLGIENISIPELDETSFICTKNYDKKSTPALFELDTRKINMNDIVDIKIDNSTNDNIIEKASKSKLEEDDDIVCIKQFITTQNDVDNSKLIPRIALSKNASTGLSKLTPSNLSPISPITVARSSLPTVSTKPSIQQSNSASDTPAKEILKSCKTTARPSISSDNVTKSPIISPSVSLPNKSTAVSSSGISSIGLPMPVSTLSNSSANKSTAVSSSDIPSGSTMPVCTSTSRTTTPISTLTDSTTKSTFTPSQSNKSTNAMSSVSSSNTIKTTPTSSTPLTYKPTATSSIPASNFSTSRGKSSSSDAGNNSSSFSIMEPTTKSLVVQLLNIVKIANASEENRPKTCSTVNSYLVTSKCVDTESSELCEILPSSSVILNVANYVKAIKEETFVKPDNVSIICGSPAIFLLKNITIQECDPNMNCVYVITSENLLPHLYKMKLKSDISTKTAPQQSINTSNTANMIIQKPLQVADLVSSANPKAVLPIQNKLRVVSNTTKMSTAPKMISTVNNSTNKPACNSNSSPSPKPQPTNSNFNCNSLKPSENNSKFNSPIAKSSISNLDALTSKLEPGTSAFGTIGFKPRISGLSSLNPVAKSPTNVPVSGASLVKPSTTNLTRNTSTVEQPTNATVLESPSIEPLTTDCFSSAVKKLPSNTSICYNYFTKPAVKTSASTTTPAKSPTNASVSHTAVTKSPANSTNSYSYKTPVYVSSSFITPVKSPASASTSSIWETFYKPSSVPSINSTSNFSKNIIYTNLSKTTAKVQTTTAVSSIMKSASPITSVSKTVLATPDTPISRVIPSPLKSTISTLPVAQLGVQSVSVNVRSNSQSTLFVNSKSGMPMKITTTPVSSQVHANASAPSSPIFITSSPVSSVVQSQRPASQKIVVAKSFSLPHPVTNKPQASAVVSTPSTYNFQPIQPTSFDTNLKTSEVLVTYDSFAAPKQSSSLVSATKQSISSQSTVIPPLKRKWGEINDDEDDDDDDDDDDPFFADYNDENYDKEYMQQQQKEISKCESKILQKEREINNLKRKIQYLKKRLNSIKDPRDTKTDEQLVEEILSKYMDQDGVQFFIGQMKVAGKTYTQFRWSEDDKLFALGLLYKNPVEYNILFQKYTLPSDKTLNKFVNRVKKAEMEDGKGAASKKK